MAMAGSYHLFKRFGVELEYMIVDRRTLRVRPIADRLLAQAVPRSDRGRKRNDDAPGEVVHGPIGWSNELALHVIEFKTARPVAALSGVSEGFQSEVRRANGILAGEGAMLLPTAMHPWMNPIRESRLWPHECGEIYQAFHRIFDCRGHGWTNLQSAHLNLPFANDAEFERLHTVIRLLLPLLPAIAASSPFRDGLRGRFLDMRLDAYRRNCARIKSVTGRMVPEWAATQAAYRRKILGRIYRDLRPLDPEGVLRHEWVNARGAIARFERGTIEVRVLDLQECPAADLGLLQFIVAVLKYLSGGDLEAQRRLRTEELAELMQRTMRTGCKTRVRDGQYLRALNLSFKASRSCTVGDIWNHLASVTTRSPTDWHPWIATILREGCLSERIIRATGLAPGRRKLRAVYGELAACLDEGTSFQPGNAVGKRPHSARGKFCRDTIRDGS